jgi:hypothetical protein
VAPVERLPPAAIDFMTTSPQPEAQLERALAAIVAEARAQVAAGREPNTGGLETRVASAARFALAQGAEGAAVERAEAAARRRLQAVASVHRARALLAREAVPPAPPPAARPPAGFRTKPTLTGTLEVRRDAGAGFRLVWDRDPSVTEWEVRVSERPDVRSDYVERSSFVLAAGETAVEVPLGDTPVRVVILGRGRTGRLQRRALVSGLTREGWRDRWQRRASAS